MISRKPQRFGLVLSTALILILPSYAQQLKLNPHLDYTSDSIDGPLITSNDPQSGIVAGKPNYVMIYGEGCYNSKRQARRTVSLAEHYGDKVNFVIIDLDRAQTPKESALVQRYYQGSIPDLVLLDSAGKPVYNQAGEQSEDALRRVLDKALAEQTTAQERR